MRVLHLLASTGWGGAERVACTLHRLAMTHGHTSRIDGPAFPELVSGVSDETGDVLPASRVERMYACWALRARGRAKKYAPDVVHLHLATPGLAAAGWFIAGVVPVVVTFHLLPPTTPWTRDYLLQIRSRRVLAAFGRRTPHPVFVSVSATDSERLAGMFPTARREVVVNAPPLPPVRDREARAVPVPQGVVRLLSVGRLNEQKGFDRLLNALSDPRVRELPWHWVVVGGGDERARLEATVAARGLQARVTFTGFQPAHRRFEQADLVICPSRFEGMPLVPLEAVAARRPVLLSRIPPHVELLGAAPESFLPVQDSDWPAALRVHLSDPSARRRLVESQSVVSSIDPRERFFQEYVRIYESALCK